MPGNLSIPLPFGDGSGLQQVQGNRIDVSTGAVVPLFGDVQLISNAGSATSAVFTAFRSECLWNGAATAAGGHGIGLYGRYKQNSVVTVGLGIGSEGVVEMQSGTLTLGSGGVFTLNAAAGGTTISEFVCCLGQITASSAAIGQARGFSARVPGNAGTITEWNAYHVPVTVRTGITKARAFKNEAADLPVVSAAPICDSSFAITAPVNAGTTILNSNQSASGTPVSTYVLNAALIATHTLTLPTAAMGNGLDDGQEILIFATGGITTITWTAGPVLYDVPTTLAANGRIRLKYFSALAGWLRVG